MLVFAIAYGIAVGVATLDWIALGTAAALAAAIVSRRRGLLVLVLAASVPLYYGAMGRLIGALGIPLQDEALLAIDASLLGGVFPDGQVSFFIDRSDVFGPHTLLGRVLTEIFQVAYFTYYVWGYGLLILLVVRMRRNPQTWTHLRMFLTAWIGAYLVSYVCFVFVPAMGPWVTYADAYVHPLEGLWLTQPIRNLIGPNQVTPDCFPSGHVAISWVVAIAALRIAPRWGRWATLGAVLITLATLGLRYHYVVDLVAAVPLALLALWWGGFLNPRLPVLLLVCVAACGGGGPGAAPGPAPATPETFELGRLDDPATARGTVSAADRDVARFEAPAFGRLVARLDLPADCDADLVLFTDAGRRLATSRANNRDPAVGPTERLFAWLHPGAYRLEVVGHAGFAGAYVLRVEVDARASTDLVTPVTSSTAALPDLAVVRSFHAVAPLPDGGAIVAGGTRDPSSQSAAILNADRTTDRFDAPSNSFVPGPPLTNGRFALSATALPTGRVLFAGGDLAGTANLFDPYTGAVSGALDMAQGMRVMHTATLLPDGRVLLTGGTRVDFTPAPKARNLATTEIFDPKTRAFTAGPALDVTRTSHAAVSLLDGRVLVIGGVGRATTEIVDVRGNASAVTYGPALTTVRDDHTATRLHDGSVLVLGGQDGSGRSLDSAELLEDPTATFAALPNGMGSRRADHRALLLPSGQVLVLGGEDDPADGSPDVILTTVDVFDPAAKTFTAMAPLLVGRDDHRVTRLRDGRVLVTGGEDAAMASIASVEAYAP